jgi:hypothetical protein
LKGSRRYLSAHTRQLIWFTAVLAGAVYTLATLRGPNGTADYGAIVLNLALLAITATTLHLAIPHRACLWIDRQAELGMDDLIFYVVGDSEKGRPRDILVQLHVALSNVGGRQAVLSRLELTMFLDRSGRGVNIGLGSITAAEYTVRDRWKDTHAVLVGQSNNLERFTFRDQIAGPFTIRPDDVITLRFRARGGIDWSDRWTLGALRDLAAALDRPVVTARLVATYRRGDELVTNEFVVPVEAKQQAMYLEALKLITKNLTVRPDVQAEPIWDT